MNLKDRTCNVKENGQLFIMHCGCGAEMSLFIMHCGCGAEMLLDLGEPYIDGKVCWNCGAVIVMEKGTGKSRINVPGGAVLGRGMHGRET